MGRYVNQAHFATINQRALSGSATKRQTDDETWRSFRLSDRVPVQQREEIVSAYAAGESAYKLAARYGISRTSVLVLASDAGIPRKLRRMNEAETDEAVRLYQQGHSFVSVGKQIGFGPTAVADALKRRGVRARPRRGA